jgi:hypothetical protein
MLLLCQKCFRKPARHSSSICAECARKEIALKTLARKALATAALLALSATPALADITPPNIAQVTAYYNAGSRHNEACSLMERAVKNMPNADEVGATYAGMSAATASVCLSQLRQNGASTSAQTYPRFVLRVACTWFDRNADQTIKACDGVPL